MYYVLCVCQTPPGLSPQASPSVVHMCVSFSYKYLALLTESGHVWMGTSNLKVRETCYNSIIKRHFVNQEEFD